MPVPVFSSLVYSVLCRTSSWMWLEMYRHCSRGSCCLKHKYFVSTFGHFLGYFSLTLTCVLSLFCTDVPNP
jgi:hypothetical protein